MVIVVILPLTELLIEQTDFIGDALSIEELVELLIIHAMRLRRIRNGHSGGKIV